MEIARRNAPQVKNRQKRVQTSRPARPQRQDRRREANPFAVAGRSAIPNLHPFDLDRPDSCLDRPRRTVTMPHQTVPTVGKLQVLHRGEKRFGLALDGLRKKPPRTRSQDIRQWIVDLVGMTKWDKVASLAHGVSLSLRGSGRLDTRLDTPPISFRHHPVSGIAQLKAAIDSLGVRSSPASLSKRALFSQWQKQFRDLVGSGDSIFCW